MRKQMGGKKNEQWKPENDNIFLLALLAICLAHSYPRLLLISEPLWCPGEYGEICEAHRTDFWGISKAWMTFTNFLAATHLSPSLY